MNGWHVFKEEARKISNEFSHLAYFEEADGKPYVLGEIVLSDETNIAIDIYSIKIEPPLDYPNRFPFVFEQGGRLPRNIDWHVFPDGHCCLKSMPEETLICKQGINLSSFITEQIIPFFFNQKHKELNGFFLQERSHGMQGNIKFFFEDIFKTKNLKVIAGSLLFIARKQKPNRVDKCFCGSNLKYRKCCRIAYQKLRQLHNNDLEEYAKIVISAPEFPSFGITR